MYQQQAQFYIYEAEEVANIIKNNRSTEKWLIAQERLNILSKFLNANLIIYDQDKNIRSFQYNSEEKRIPIKLTQQDLSKLWNGENIIFTGKFNKQTPELFLTAIPIKENNEILGAVVVYSSINFLNQQILGITSISFWAALFGILVVTLLSIFIVKNLTKPLRKMGETARAISKGDFGKQISIVSNDEVGLLASSLNHMSIELKEKIDAIEQLDKIRQEFVSNVSHELRTPLTIIQSFSEAILDGLVKSEEEKKVYLSNILSESKRLKRLVEGLLDLRSLEVEKELNLNNMEFISVSKLIYVTTNNFRSLANDKNIKLTVSPYQGKITVLGHIDRLKQVMTNLLGNAITFTPAGGEIKVTWGKSDKKDEAFIRVTDNGPGIPKNELSNIWERFYMVEKSRVRKSKGTGLGLAITKKIVELHGGRVDVESIFGEGTSFIIYLPSIEELED